MSMGKFIAFIAIIASILIPQAVFSDDAVYRTIPFYNLRDPGQKEPKLQLRVKEKVYPPDAVYTLPEMLERAKNPLKTPEDNVLGYFGYVLTGKAKEIERFYYPRDKENIFFVFTPVEVAEISISEYKGTDRVRLLRLWHFGLYKKIMVELLSPTERVGISTLGTKKIDGKYYKTFGGGIAGILGYITGNYREGVGNRFDPVELPYSLTYYARDSINDITIKENPATLYFTGKAYEFEDGWVPVGDVDPVLKFVHDAMTIAAKGTNEEYLALFTGKDKEYMEGLLESYRRKGEITDMTFRSFKYRHSGEYMKKDIKHIFTLDLGTEYIHYYRLKGESKLRHMIIGNKEGKLWLMVKGNINILIKDENLLNKIIEIWEAKNKKVDNE